MDDIDNEIWNSEDYYFEHFGVKMQKEKVIEHMTRDNFVFPEEKNSKIQPTKLVIKNAYRSFDTNMRFFKSLNREEFEKCLKDFLNSKEMKDAKEIHSFNECKGEKGIYILVLDDYNQIYIGQTKDDFKNRITKHWRNKLTYLKFPFLFASILPIDCFGAKDTTRIYILPENDIKKIDMLEEKLISIFPRDFCLNRISGGQPQSELQLYKKLTNPFKRNFDDNFNTLKQPPKK